MLADIASHSPDSGIIQKGIEIDDIPGNGTKKSSEKSLKYTADNQRIHTLNGFSGKQSEKKMAGKKHDTTARCKIMRNLRMKL